MCLDTVSVCLDTVLVCLDTVSVCLDTVLVCLNNNNNIYLKSNIQCTYRYEFSGLYNNNIQLQ